MNKIESLLQKLCPNGVTYKKLGDIGVFYGGLSGKNKNDFVDGNAKYISYMNVFSNITIDISLADYVKINEYEKQNSIEYGDIIFTSSSETFDEVGMSSVLTEEPNETIYLNSFCFGFRLFDKTILNPEYSKYIFRYYEVREQIKKASNGVTRFNLSKKLMKNVEIPIPPMEIQTEIARILDSFTEYSAKLTQELNARKKQYDYYLHLLLDLGDNVESKLLKDFCTIKTGKKPEEISSKQLQYEYINAGTTNSGYCDDYNCDGDTVTTPSRGQGGIGFIGYQKEPFWLGPLCYKIKSKNSNILNKYIYYYLISHNYLILQFKKEGGTPAVNRADLEQLSIPVPSLVEQKRIVSILDKFETICNDILFGIPAELNARKKQYEYYRDKLLSFSMEG